MSTLGKSPNKYIITCNSDRDNFEIQIFELGNSKECFTAALDRDKLNNGRFAEAVTAAFSTGIQPGRFSGIAMFVLPAFLYSFDYITLPTLNRSKMTDAFKAEARTLYKNYANLVLDSQVVSQGKLSTTYRVVLAQKNILTVLKDTFAAKGIQIVSFVPYASACIGGAGKLNAAYRKTPSLLLLASYGRSDIIINGKDTVLGQISLPFGYEVLRNDRVVDESLLYYEKNAELAVLNAREKARATKLTMAINIESEHIDDSLPDDADSAAAEQPPARSADSNDDEDEYGETSDEKQQNQNVKTATKRTAKVLPKFMRRPTPADADGFILENFRLFEKRILLTARECKYTDYLPSIENIWLYLPEEYSHVAEHVGSDPDNAKMKWGNLISGKGKTQSELLQSGALSVKGSKLPSFVL